MYMLNGMGLNQDVNLEALVKVGAFISKEMGRISGSKVTRAMLAKGKE